MVIDTLTIAHNDYWDIPTMENLAKGFAGHKIDILSMDLTYNWVPIPVDWKTVMEDNTTFDLEGFIIKGLEKRKRYLLSFAYTQESPKEKDIIGMMWVTGGESCGGMKCPLLTPKEGFNLWMKKHEGGKEDIEIALLYNKWKVT